MTISTNNFDFLLTGNAWVIIGMFTGVSFWIGFIHASLLLKKSVGWIKLIPQPEKAEYQKQYQAKLDETKKLNELVNKNPLKGV
jgi:hypothetical protein